MQHDLSDVLLCDFVLAVTVLALKYLGYYYRYKHGLHVQYTIHVDIEEQYFHINLSDAVLLG